MVNKGIVLGHIISQDGIKVDKAKTDLIVNLSPPTCVKEVRSFLGHAGFYRRFIRDFSKIAKPLSNLLAKDVLIYFFEESHEPFSKLKKALTSAPILHPPIWGESFELMCDASDYAIRVVLGQHIDKKPHVIYYASHMLNDAQLNYIVTEKEFFAVVFGFEKFRSYLIGSHVIVYTGHSSLKHLLSTKDVKPRLVRLILLLQEFDCEIKDKKGSENLVANHLSRSICDRKSGSGISKCFPDEQLYDVHPDPWYTIIVKYLVAGRIPKGWTKNDKDRFFHLVKFFVWDDPYLFKYCSDLVFRRCIPDHEVRSVLSFCHDQACGRHFSGRKTAVKILQYGFHWLTLFKDAFKYCKSCPRYQ